MFGGKNPNHLIYNLAFVAIYWVVPLLLVFTAYRRFQRLGTGQIWFRLGVIALLVSEVMLLVVGAFIVAEATGRLSRVVSPFLILGINLPLCLIALFTTIAPKARETNPLRRAIATAGIYLAFVWLETMLMY